MYERSDRCIVRSVCSDLCVLSSVYSCPCSFHSDLSAVICVCGGGGGEGAGCFFFLLCFVFILRIVFVQYVMTFLVYNSLFFVVVVSMYVDLSLRSDL